MVQRPPLVVRVLPDMRHVLLVLITGAAMPACAHAGPSVFRVIEDRLAGIACETVDSRTAAWKVSLRADNTWADIDYADRNGTLWSLCSDHLGRADELAKAARKDGDAAAGDAARRALAWWLKARPTVGNWWWNQIGAPQRVAQAAVCLRPVLAEVERDALVAYLKVSRIGMTGQNKVWLANICLQRALLSEDAELLAQASRAISDQLVIQGVEGIQPDWSYHQHGNQPQFGNYGLSFIGEMTRLAAVLADTPYAFPRERMVNLENLLGEGYAWTVWKGLLDVSCVPRQFWPAAQRRKGRQVLAAAEMLSRTGPEGRRVAQIFKGTGPVGFRTFPNSAMSFYRQPGWMVSHKGGTRKIRGVETDVIGDNELGQHLQDGLVCTVVTGREYDDVYPLWNWRMLPGVTSYPDLPPARYRRQRGREGQNELEDYRGEQTAGGGCVTFGVSRDGLSYRQRIVCSPDGILAETTGITSTNPTARVATCVEAANAAPDARILSQTATETRVRNGAIEYVVCAPKAAVEVFIGERTGDFHDFMRGMKPRKLTGRIFEVIVNHGVLPRDAGCRYRVLIRPARPHGSGADVLRTPDDPQAATGDPRSRRRERAFCCTNRKGEIDEGF